MFENELKSTASEDVLNIPVGALNLSSDIMRVINTNRIYKNNTIRPQIETIGDLLRVGEENFQSMIIRRKFELSDIDEAYIQINEKLAYLGLRFPDSEFTADEIRITSLELSPREAEFMRYLYKKVRDVNELCILGKRKLERELEKSKLICNLQKIEDEVEKLGMFIEGFKVKNINNKAKIFPLNKYEKYLSEQTKRERCGKITELSSGMPIEKVLTLESSISHMHKLGIYTVDELVSNLYSEKLLLGNRMYNRIRRDLAKHNLLIMGDNSYEIVNGQVVTKKRSMDLKIPTQIPAKDINDMEEDEREAFLNLSLEDFDLDPIAIEYLHKLNIFKVGEFANYTRKEVYDLADSSKVIPDYITDSFFKYGVVNRVDNAKNVDDTYYEPLIEKKKHNYDSESSIKRNYTELTDKRKLRFLNQPLFRFGVDNQVVRLLKSKLFITTVKDFILYKPAEIISLIGENAYNDICDQFDRIGLNIEEENRKFYSKDDESEEPNF